MAQYALADHVFVCLNGEHLVLLDLKEDRYWALEAAHTAGLGALVDGWPVRSCNDAPTADPPSPETTAAIELLQGRGLLTQGIPPGKVATPVTATVPMRELSSETDTSAGARSGSWLKFLTASAVAKFTLRIWPFERVIRRVKRRKELLGPDASPLDAQRAALARKKAPTQATPSAAPDAKSKKEVQGVFVVDKNMKKVDFKPVETGIQGATDVEVTKGLSDGQEIVTGSYKILRTLKVGAKVKVDNTVAKKDDNS